MVLFRAFAISFILVFLCKYCIGVGGFRRSIQRKKMLEASNEIGENISESLEENVQTERIERPTILIGMMVSDAEPLRKIEAHRRSLRNFTKWGFARCDIRLFFFFGRSALNASIHGPDVVRGDFPENMNHGKTRHWFIWAVNWFENNQRIADNRSVVIKMDSDSTVRWRLLDALVFKLLYPTYFGRPARVGMCRAEVWLQCLVGVIPKERCMCPECTLEAGFRGKCWFYMGGGMYGVSLSIARRLKECWRNNFIGIEDALFGLTLKRCGIDFRPQHVKGNIFRHTRVLKDHTVEEVNVWDWPPKRGSPPPGPS